MVTAVADLTGGRFRADRLRALAAVVLAATCLMNLGCQDEAPTISPVDQREQLLAEHRARYGRFDVPRELGSIENIGLQLPVVSPDGRQVLYLRTDQDYVSPMTLLGSPAADDTPEEGFLQVWLRPTEGHPAGVAVSKQRWAHTPTWSPSGRRIAYVVNAPPISYIVCLDLTSGKETVVGTPGGVNCLPRFNNSDNTLLFCSGPGSHGPFRVCRQEIGESEPTPLTPGGSDYLLPLAADEAGNVYAARNAGGRLHWGRYGLAGMTDLAPSGGSARRPDVLQVWAGISEPMSPDYRAWMYYDAMQHCISMFRLDQRGTRDFRSRGAGTIAACWLDGDTIALATLDRVIILRCDAGASIELFNGQWIPWHYVRSERRLLLLGAQRGPRFKIVEVIFQNPPSVGDQPPSKGTDT